MPYITPDRRPGLTELAQHARLAAQTQGELAYLIYRLVLPVKGYATLSQARAVLRDVLDILNEDYLDYEEDMKKRNGDILV